MDMSPNQFTEKMRAPTGAHRSPFWEHLDGLLVIEEAQIAEQKRWLEHDSTPIDVPEAYAAPPYDGKETYLGHLMMFGEIDATEAYRRLGE